MEVIRAGTPKATSITTATIKIPKSLNDVNCGNEPERVCWEKRLA
jgi:hypothetical protein